MLDLTEEQLKSYIKCLRNLKPGDEVDYCCIDAQRSCFTCTDTGFYRRATVIITGLDLPNSYNGTYPPNFTNEKTIIIGTPGEQNSSFAYRFSYHQGLIRTLLDTPATTRGCSKFLSLTNDILIKRIYKK